ncbi:carbohydrate esterase family 1 protein [Penicillium lividum]|nr:carbohydrate esterase family 1 protein [Penicillium lividum]
MTFFHICTLLLGATLAVATCGDNLLPPGQSKGGVFNISITSDGKDRSFLLSIPPKYDSKVPTPLILSYHGGTKNATDQLELDQLTNPEFNTRDFVIYPQGINNVWQGVPGVTTNDILFTQDILDQVTSQYCIDTTRIWATGKSDGGGFVNRLACDPETSIRIAAFAPVSGAYYENTSPCVPDTVHLTCHAARTDIPFLAFHGGNDTTIPYTGGERKGECLPSIPHFIQEWAVRDHLSVRNRTLAVASDTVLYSFGACELVGLIYDSVIGHDWPSTVPNSDNQVAGHHVASFNATPIILDFFYRHT